ncbi:MAG: HAD family hydrolase [Acidimicrobiales bacterium]
MRDGLHWMRRLAEHYARCRSAHPDDELLLLFDIDGTILDARHLVAWTLHAYDRTHGTRLFEDLQATDVDTHENEVAELLARRQLAPGLVGRVDAWYRAHRWSPEAVRTAHQPYRGVIDVIRWFQIQPRTSVGLNTGRPEALREATLASLNGLGGDRRVRFTDDLLFMNSEGWERNVAAHKVEGLRHFEAAGYRVVAVVDNEPEILDALAAVDRSHEILFLHADTIYQSAGRPLPRSVAGSRYDLTALVAEGDLPRQVELVWHGVNDQPNLRQLLASPVRWAEVDVRRHPVGPLVLRHDPFPPYDLAGGGPGLLGSSRSNGTSGGDGAHGTDGADGLLRLSEVLDDLRRGGKAVVVDLKEPGLVDEVLALVDACGFADADLWFNGRLDVLGEEAIRSLRAAHPGAVIQCPVDFVSPTVSARPLDALERLEVLTAWGISRFSLAWAQPRIRQVCEHLDEWGCEVNLYAVADLAQFLEAVLLLPRSITADFNFPEWHYFGRGAGHGGHYHRYNVDPHPPVIDVA